MPTKFTNGGDPPTIVKAVLYTDTKDGVANIMRFLDRKAVRMYGKTIGFDSHRLNPGDWLIKTEDERFWPWEPTPFKNGWTVLDETLGELP